jgi:pimeloyl-ACP methyl ester carboxylesterase
MRYIIREGARLAYKEMGEGNRSLVFVHGWTCNHSHFSPQMDSFAGDCHVVAVDLRGHGRSDKPQMDYTLGLFAEDVVEVCNDLMLDKPIVVGHSMGGAIGLEIATRYPNLLSGIVLIDTVLQPEADFLDALHGMYDNLVAQEFAAGMEHIASLLQLPSRDTSLRSAILEGMKHTPREVALSAFEHHILAYDSTESILSCRVPSAYIRSLDFVANLEKLKQMWRDLYVAETLDSGHFSMLEVPDQINAMLRRFCYRVWGDVAENAIASY